MASTPSSVSHQTKRSHHELSPENESDFVGKVKTIDLMNMIKETINNNLDEKLKNVATKSDMEEIKYEIGAVNKEILALKSENIQLKEEIAILKREKEVTTKNLIWLEQQTCNKKLIFKGVLKNDSPKKAIRSICTDILKIDIGILTAKKIFEKDDHMSVIVEFESSLAVANVFKNTKKLAGTKISVERDILPLKQEKKKVFLQIRKKILNISKKHKIIVRDDKLKIKDKWFVWNAENILICGKEKGVDVLKGLYGEDVENLDLNYENLLKNMYSKN